MLNRKMQIYKGMEKTRPEQRKRENVVGETFASNAIPIRKGLRPRTLSGPLHIQCTGHGDRKYLEQLLAHVLSWPHIEALPTIAGRPDTIPIRIENEAAVNDSSAFISAREFARVLLGAQTIYLALPLVCAHWAIVRGWAEPHFLCSFGLLPPGAVLIYTPKDQEELAVCYSFFSDAYQFACKFSRQR